MPTDNSNKLAKIDTLLERAKEFRRRGAMDEAASAVQQAVVICKNMEEEDFVRLGCLLDELGTISFWMMRYTDAEKSYTEALETLELASYPAHPCLTRVLDHLAHLYIAAERFDKASSAARRALHIRQSTLLLSDAATVENLRMCAIIELANGNLEDAESFLRKAIDILEPSALGPVEEFVYLLATVYQMQGKNSEAESCYKQALVIFSRRHGRPVRHAACLSDYAKFLRQMGRVRDAEKLEQALPQLMEAASLEVSTGVKELDSDLPNTEIYQRLMYPATILH